MLPWRRDRAARRGRESGQALPLLGLAMMAMVAMTGLAVDGGNLYLARRELVRLTDSAALAAAGGLSGHRTATERGLSDDAWRDRIKARATARANEYVRLHGFDPDQPGNTLAIGFPGNLATKKLVQVEAKRDVPLYFMPIFGIDKVQVSSGGRTGEAAPVDIVLVQDISSSQKSWTHCLKNTTRTGTWDDKLVAPPPLWSGYRGDDCSAVSNATGGMWQLVSEASYPYHPYEPTYYPHNGDWNSGLANPIGTRPNVPWLWFAYEQDGARYFVSQLDSRYDQVGLASFNTNGTINYNLTTNFTDVQRTIGYSPRAPGETGISGLAPSGGTNTSAGISKGVAALTGTGARWNAVAAMILLSDGSATCIADGSSCGNSLTPSASVNTQARRDAMSAASSAAAAGITIYTVYFGDETWSASSERLLQCIADLTDNKTLDNSGECQPIADGVSSAYGPPISDANLKTKNYSRVLLTTELLNNPDAVVEALQESYDSILEKIYARLVD